MLLTAASKSLDLLAAAPAKQVRARARTLQDNVCMQKEMKHVTQGHVHIYSH